MAEKWIQGAIKHPGALHRELHVPEGEKIPKSKIAKAAHNDNPKLAKRARLAETLSKMHHGAKGKVEIHMHEHTHKHKDVHHHHGDNEHMLEAAAERNEHLPRGMK